MNAAHALLWLIGAGFVGVVLVLLNKNMADTRPAITATKALDVTLHTQPFITVQIPDSSTPQRFCWKMNNGRGVESETYCVEGIKKSLQKTD